MQIDITKILTNQLSKISINDKINIPKELLTDSRIDDLKDIWLDAKIYVNEDNEIIINGKLTGKMLLKDDITLEPVLHQFDTEIEEILNKSENILDITEILWQNILVEIPSKVRTTDEDVCLSGNGWRVISEDRYNEERRKSNNPFMDLEKMLEIKEDK